MPRPLSARLMILLTPLLLAAGPASAGLQAQMLEDAIPASNFRDGFVTRQWSVATDINETGQLFGYQLTADGQMRSFNLAFASNPQMTVVDTPDFMALSGADAVCFLGFFCTTEKPFGIRLTDSGALTSFVGAPLDSSPLPGSLPLSYLPGDFVEENRQGVVASTQISADGEQFGAVLLKSGRIEVLPDIPWLVDLSDGALPRVLGYDGEDGDCQVFGLGCGPEDPEHCEDDRHRHTQGVGHHSHGRGHGYGHHCDHATGNSQASGPQPLSVTQTGALLLVFNDTGYSLLRFPGELPDHPGLRAEQLFPLAMNQQEIVLRGTLTDGDQLYPGRLLSCRYNHTTPDADDDQLVDCQDGLQLREASLADSQQINTVLGFSLNDNGRLIGNFGFTAAGIGLPLLMDADDTQATLLVNHLDNPFLHELSVITALNNFNAAVGYAYAGCGDLPDAVRLTTDSSVLSALGFVYPQSIPNTWVAPGGSFSLSPQGQGASGAALYRFQRWDSVEQRWQLLQDWSDQGYTGSAPPEPGELCVRMDLADSLDMDDQRSLILRLRVTEDGLESGAEPLLPAAITPSSIRIADATEDALLLGILGWGQLLVLILLGWRRH